MIDKISQNLLVQISGLHKLPTGAVSFRKNGRSEVVRSTENIEIVKKPTNDGIDIFVHSSCKGEACHIPVVVSENGLFDLTYNDFYIEDGAEVVIVAGCGVHSSGESGHNGIHSFYVGKNAKVSYVENHLALGGGKRKVLSPTTKIVLEENATMVLNTSQIGGVDFSDRRTEAVLKNGAMLEVYEKVLTDRFEVAKTNFKVVLQGENSKCNIVSRSVAKGESEQVFKSNLIGKNICTGRVECDAILLDSACVISEPKVTAKHNEATLNHEATIGKIAGDQLLKLMTLGLTEKEAEERIVAGFLK